MSDIFEEFESEFLKFERIEVKLNSRPDLHAFILLNRIIPGTTDMVSAADHDQIYLAVDPDALAAVATKDELRDLCRCGVIHDSSVDSLAMHV